MAVSGPAELDPRRWFVLATVGAAFFMTVLDISIVNVALPTMIGSAALMAAFLVIERRVREPLIPFRIFRIRTVTGANAVGFLLGGVIFSNFFVLTLYVQDVLHYSALKAGVTFVATAGTAVAAAGVSQALVTRVGVKPILGTGLLLLVAGMVWYTQIPVNGHYALDLLPGYLLVGVGIAFSFVPVSIAALAGVEAQEAGLASGLINTSQQVGGAIGVAFASTVFTTHFDHHRITPKLLTTGYANAFWVMVAFGLAAFVATLALVRRAELQELPEAVATAG